MTRPSLSVTIITLNEEANLPHAIKSVEWAKEVIVIDSGSTDKTVEIAKKLGARVIHNPWPGYGQQKNFAQKQASCDWILNIDADEVVPPELALEIQNAITQVDNKKTEAWGFYFPRKTYYLGRWIQHGGWYPNYLVRLVHRNHASWTEPNVHEELKVSGPVQGLSSALHHYAFSSIQDQILTNLQFSRLGSQDLKRTGQKPSLGRLILKPIGKFLETYIIKRGFLDGLPGFIISVNAAHSMFLKYAYLSEAKIKNENPDHRQ
jgi:glycosyltransferase involved in cell wall biosynthesis